MQITRRYFLQSTGLIAAYCGLSPLNLLASTSNVPGTQPALAPATVKRNKTLVVIFLRGGTDGLNFIVPYKDPGYARLRHNLFIPPPAPAGAADAAKSTIDLDGYFGLHPLLKPMLPLFDSGVAVAAHAVGYDRNTRSHFEEQDTWETGMAGNTLGSDGWLNRHLATSEGPGPLRAVAVGDTLPRILRGKAMAYAIEGIEDLAIPGVRGESGTVMAAGLEHAYRVDPRDHVGAARDLLDQTGQATLDSIQRLRGLTEAHYQPGVAYPKTEFARRMGEVARLIKSDVGLEVAEVDFVGWDTHQGQAYNITEGTFGTLAGTLAGGLAAFRADLGDRMEDVLVLTLSDFGRTAAENGTAGTDHGWANCMLAMGGPVLKAGHGQKRPVLTTWPGLLPDQLHQGRDLLHTTDFRDVLGEVVRVHLGNPNLQRVLPGHTFKSVGLVA